MKQLTIFDSPGLQPTLTIAHNKHAGNDEILQENRNHFEGQAKKVLEHLLNGERVTSERMYELYKIVDVRARIFSLKKAGYAIIAVRIPNGRGAKEWSLNQKSK